MAAGFAGDARTGEEDTIPNLRATMETMSDSITALTNKMALLLEDPGGFNRRQPDNLNTPIGDSDEKGPAVRERIYARAHESDRVAMEDMGHRINELEASLAFYNAELTTDRDNLDKMSITLRDLRSPGGMTSVSTGAAKEKQVVTAIRGFDKLKVYKGVATEWKE